MIKKLEDKFYSYGHTDEFTDCAFRLPPEITNKLNEMIEEINKLKKEE